MTDAPAPDAAETKGNFEAVPERTENDNFHDSIYEADYKGLLVARCNQNGQHPWQTRAILNGLNGKKESGDTIAAVVAERDALKAENERLLGTLKQAIANCPECHGKQSYVTDKGYPGSGFLKDCETCAPFHAALQPAPARSER